MSQLQATFYRLADDHDVSIADIVTSFCLLERTGFSQVECLDTLECMLVDRPICIDSLVGAVYVSCFLYRGIQQETPLQIYRLLQTYCVGHCRLFSDVYIQISELLPKVVASGMGITEVLCALMSDAELADVVNYKCRLDSVMQTSVHFGWRSWLQDTYRRCHVWLEK